MQVSMPSAAGGAPIVAMAATTLLSAETVLGTGVIMAGVAGSRPAFGTAGRLYFSTDTFVLERDTGSAWVKVGASAHSGLDTITADQHQHRTEAKDTAGAASSEAVTWTVAFSGTPAVATSLVKAATNPEEVSIITARSTTAATVQSVNTTGTNSNRVKCVIAQGLT